MDILCIVNGIDELLKELEVLKDIYKFSKFTLDVFTNKKINPMDSYIKYKNKKWVIYLCYTSPYEDNYGYVCIKPYEIHCLKYLEKGN